MFMNAQVHIGNKEMPEVGNAPLSCTEINREIFFRIPAADTMRPFFMSIVSDSDHWMFISSNGGISAGRKDADHALFPYYTDDKINDSAEFTGSKTIFLITANEQTVLWEPFSSRSEGRFSISRNLYKSRFSNKIIFEEVNHTLQLIYQYEWNTSDQFGFIKRSRLLNHSQAVCRVRLLDGLQNIMPCGVGSDLQNRVSNLVDAYKRIEHITDSSLALFSLSAIIVDKAEPSEALKTNLAWSVGLDNPLYLLSNQQLQHFRAGKTIVPEKEIRGERSCYYVVSEITVQPQEQKEWMIVADVNKNHAAVIELLDKIKYNQELIKELLNDVKLGTERLQQLVAAADGIQYSSDILKDSRHYSNVLFNIMRGGIFDANYTIEKNDIEKYFQKTNRLVFESSINILNALPETFPVFELKQVAVKSGDPGFKRLATEYLPLKFSRRHGDPSRPWNRFSINTKNETDGSKILDYEGNWRDIFQNWEALACSYPYFLEGMIYRFLDASTFEGYNPYRVTKEGFDWEVIEADNPWSYIGYWGDHQVIYLLKLLEIFNRHQPGTIQQLFSESIFVYANVPYKIKSYTAIVNDPKNTIVFDHDSDRNIRNRMKLMGTDGALLCDSNNQVYRVNFLEKILATLLSRISNFVPEGGIWMNTQRPEWNDANNALVGNGLSMVTLYYLRRFLKFFESLFTSNTESEYEVSAELSVFFKEILSILEKYSPLLSTGINDADRKNITDELGLAGSRYRTNIYDHSFSGRKESVNSSKLVKFTTLALDFMEQSIRSNKREDGLYHAYNLISYNSAAIKITRLSEMLEGQVAVLSSGFLSATESIELLDALGQSKLYREDQQSYLLYPDKALPAFLEKNTMPESSISGSSLLKQLIAADNRQVVEKDMNGNIHFNGNFRNAQDLETALDELDASYTVQVKNEKQFILQLFEELFDHRSFTGRSGTFFAYEGLGSIYWHMVSKLLLAVEETCTRTLNNAPGTEVSKKLIQQYYTIKEGIGVHKAPSHYGAFPTDPYSHTPAGKGAQQPGMTGQVKEDILSRMAELGIYIEQGRLGFKPMMLRKNEFSEEARTVEFFNVQNEKQETALDRSSLCFTYCAVPVIYTISDQEGIIVNRINGSSDFFESCLLNKEDSNAIFKREGTITMIKVMLKDAALLD